MTRRGLLAALLLAQPQGAVACTQTPLARIPLGRAGSLPLVELEVDDKPASFVVDTGAQRSMVTPAAVARLGLALDEWTATSTSGIGGIERRRNALPRTLALGGLALRRHTLAGDRSLTVATLAHDVVDGRRIDGLLGRDYLAGFDLAFDIPARRLGLYRVEGCQGGFLPWPGAVALPTENPADSALVVRLELDGVALRALLDTGASATTVTAIGMHRLGLTAEGLAGESRAPAEGVGPHGVAAWSHRFTRLRIGAEITERPRLAVAAIRPVPFVDMLLGADWLAARPVWISFAERRVFVAPR